MRPFSHHAGSVTCSEMLWPARVLKKWSRPTVLRSIAGIRFNMPCKAVPCFNVEPLKLSVTILPFTNTTLSSDTFYLCRCTCGQCTSPHLVFPLAYSRALGARVSKLFLLFFLPQNHSSLTVGFISSSSFSFSAKNFARGSTCLAIIDFTYKVVHVSIFGLHWRSSVGKLRSVLVKEGSVFVSSDLEWLEYVKRRVWFVVTSPWLVASFSCSILVGI